MTKIGTANSRPTAMGMPKEGYGFSNDAKGTLGAPSFEAASFSYNGQSLKMTIALQY